MSMFTESGPLPACLLSKRIQLKDSSWECYTHKKHTFLECLGDTYAAV